MAFSLSAVLSGSGKWLGTAMRQTKCEKMANPPPSRDYFLAHRVVVVVALSHLGRVLVLHRRRVHRVAA
jgi:hypothetical protein